jgi:selenium donor protein
MKPIYLDYNATTPLDPEVIAAMLPYLETGFGNPSSNHSFGREAKAAIENARMAVASLIDCAPDEIVFTSGGSEANNLALKGIVAASKTPSPHIITSVFEHPAILEVCRYLSEECGASISYVPVNREGFIDLAALESEIRPTTVLITVMHSNNEIGSLQPIAEIAALAAAHKIPFHSDAAQSIGKIPVSVRELGVDLLTIVGHKFYGPKGVGALYIRRGVQLKKLIHGADHEHSLRAGTENVLQIVGLGAAALVAKKSLVNDMQHTRALRESFWEILHSRFSERQIHGQPVLRRNSPSDNCLPNTLNFSVYGLDSALLMSAMPELALSSGAACHAEHVSVSPTLESIHVPKNYVAGTLRISLGRSSAVDEVTLAAKCMADTIDRLLPHTEQRTELSLGTDSTVKLTQFTQGLGCACKMRPQVLERVLRGALPEITDERVLCGFKDAEDSSVFRLPSGELLVQSVDFFTPIVDDPHTFGAIAAANALSDIYAMGATPIFALSIVGFPSTRLPEEALREILVGASEVCNEAGIFIVGGHTVEDNEPKFGLAVSGLAKNERSLWTNAGAQSGDLLILTKPLGTGIITTAIKHKLSSEAATSEAIRTMRFLNKTACEMSAGYPIHACTDITGFGLLAHLCEMMKASDTVASINAANVPVLPDVLTLIRQGVLPGGTQNNRAFTEPHVRYSQNVDESMRILLNDAQTSGGLLLAVPEESAMALLQSLRQSSACPVSIIGKVARSTNQPIVSIAY